VVSPPRAIIILAGGLAVWWIVTLPFAVHLRTALWGAAGRGNGLVQHLALLGLFIALASMRIGVGGVQRIGRIALAVLVGLSAYAIVQAAGLDVFVWPNVRPGSTIGHPVPLAAILALGAPIGLAEVSAARSPRALAGAAVATSAIVFSLGTTLSRGPWIGAAAGLACTLALTMRVGGHRRVVRAGAQGFAPLRCQRERPHERWFSPTDFRRSSFRSLTKRAS